MKNPKISVIMPAYDAEKYIAEAIESTLNQTFADFEFVIIDDGSTDSTGKIIEEYARKDERIIFLKNQKNVKISKTLNKGIKIAKGKYIARRDADDWSHPDGLEKQYHFMEEHPEIGISGGSMEVVDKHGKRIGIRRYNLTDAAIRKKLFRYSPFSHPLVMIRRDILSKCGLYNPELVPAEDYDLYFRIGMLSKFGNLDDIILKYKMLEESITSRKEREMESKTLAIRKKAVREYGYKMSLADKIYWILQYLSIFITPPVIKLWLFNKMRNSK